MYIPMLYIIVCVAVVVPSSLHRFHKKVLQLSENLLSQTSSSKNCWEEADKLVLSLTQLDLSILEGIS